MGDTGFLGGACSGKGLLLINSWTSKAITYFFSNVGNVGIGRYRRCQRRL